MRDVLLFLGGAAFGACALWYWVYRYFIASRRIWKVIAGLLSVMAPSWLMRRKQGMRCPKCGNEQQLDIEPCAAVVDINSDREAS